MKRTLVLALAISVMLVVSACSHMPDKADASADNSSNATTADNSGSSSALPFSGDKDKPSEHKGFFSHPEELTIPSGTPVTIRLSTAVSSASNHAGDRFEAVLDAPLVITAKPSRLPAQP